MDYYQVLEVQRTASEVDIKRAYKRLAMKWHPNRNQHNRHEAERLFKVLSEAYEVLSDGSKRDTYNRCGFAVCTVGGGGGGGGGFGSGVHYQSSQYYGHSFRKPEIVFTEFFGGRDPFTEAFGDDDFVGGSSVTHHSMSVSQPAVAFDQGFGGVSTFGGGMMGCNTGVPSFGMAVGHPGGMGMGMGMGIGSGMTSGMGGGGAGFSSSSSSFSSSSYGGGGCGGGSGNISAMSSSTKIINGKKITTKRMMENGQERVEVEEDGILKSLTINGKEQLCQN